MKPDFSKHAEIEMARRNIEKKDAIAVINKPQQKFEDNDKWIYQSKYFDKQLKKEISKIAKYWRN